MCSPNCPIRAVKITIADQDPAEMARAEMDRTKRTLIKPLTDADKKAFDEVETMLTESYAAMIERAKNDLAG